MEKLLNKDEINEVIKKSTTFPVYENPIIILGSMDHKTIIGKSPEKRLIMIFGNEDTGYQHITNRHGYAYEYTRWKKDKQDELDIPTVFPESELLFTGWPSIVDSIYDKGNLNYKNNNRENEFDLFIGDYIFNEIKYDCYLLLYKNTKIIHTFYLNVKQRKFNKIKPKGFHFIKGKMTCKMDFENNKEILIIPYLNNKNEIIFQLEMTRHLILHQEEWVLKFWKENKQFKRLLVKYNNHRKLSDRMGYYMYWGLDEIEKEIGKINNMSLNEIMNKCKQ